jgi:zinc protease
MLDAEGPRPFIAYAPVQTDQTAPSMQELRTELQGITSTAPVTEDELAKTKNEQTLTLPGRFETISAVGSAVGEIVRFGLPDDYYDTFAENVRGLTLTDVNAVAQDVVRPDGLVWVVVGDREVIEPSIRALGFGEVRLMSENGQPISARVE